MSPKTRDISNDFFREAIVDGHNIVYVSAATAWEISIKQTIGKLKIPESDYLEELRLHRFTPLSITTEHALAIENLPPHHGDPFDRMLIAQALEEKLVWVTRDPRYYRSIEAFFRNWLTVHPSIFTSRLGASWEAQSKRPMRYAAYGYIWEGWPRSCGRLHVMFGILKNMDVLIRYVQITSELPRHDFAVQRLVAPAPDQHGRNVQFFEGSLVTRKVIR